MCTSVRPEAASSTGCRSGRSSSTASAGSASSTGCSPPRPRGLPQRPSHSTATGTRGRRTVQAKSTTRAQLGSAKPSTSSAAVGRPMPGT
eukprot:13828341-Alexandrium_andersonii.AAC.1